MADLVRLGRERTCPFAREYAYIILALIASLSPALPFPLPPPLRRRPQPRRALLTMATNHRDNLAQHIHISSADDLSYSVSPSSGINDTIQTIVTGRKCWKTMKGKGEVVWPPYLEAALVEGEPSFPSCLLPRVPGRRSPSVHHLPV